MPAVSPYPLSWPEHIERSRRREGGQFRSSLSAAMKNVRSSLERFGKDSGKPVRDIVMSSNVTLGDDMPSDPGVAVWFTWDDMPICIPVDRYSKVESNLQAIHHVLEARRTEMRHGTLALVRASMKGFTALPSPDAVRKRTCWQILDLQPGSDRDAILSTYKLLAKCRHPDAPGGSDAKMSELNRARDEALAEVGS